MLLLPPAVILRMLPTDPTPEAYLPQVLQNLRFKTCVSAHTRRRVRKAAPVCTARFAQPRFAQPGLRSPVCIALGKRRGFKVMIPFHAQVVLSLRFLDVYYRNGPGFDS